MNRLLRIGLPAAGLVALGAATSSLFGIGVAGASPAATTAKPPTITMYANVDQNGDLGSHVGAVSAVWKGAIGEPLYTVTFNRTITNCAAEVTSGYAGGRLQAVQWPATAIYNGTKAFDVKIGLTDDSGTSAGPSAFMITVTCHS